MLLVCLAAPAAHWAPTGRPKRAWPAEQGAERGAPLLVRRRPGASGAQSRRPGGWARARPPPTTIISPLGRWPLGRMQRAPNSRLSLAGQQSETLLLPLHLSRGPWAARSAGVLGAPSALFYFIHLVTQAARLLVRRDDDDRWPAAPDLRCGPLARFCAPERQSKRPIVSTGPTPR